MALHVTKAYTCRLLRSTISAATWPQQEHIAALHTLQPLLTVIMVTVSLLACLSVCLHFNCRFACPSAVAFPRVGFCHIPATAIECVYLNDACSSNVCFASYRFSTQVTVAPPSPPLLSRVSCITETFLSYDFPKQLVLHACNSLASEFSCSQQQL